MQENFADRLLHAIALKNAPVCVGLDPMLDRLPDPIDVAECAGRATQTPSDRPARTAAQRIAAFGRAVIETIAPLVPAIKINIAFFEPYGGEGFHAYQELVAGAQRAGLIVIGDVKRGDIGHTSGQYALAHIGRERPGEPSNGIPDAITINPYFGIDGVRPFVEAARVSGRGLFVLVQTSNESAAQIQALPLANGTTVVDRVAELVAEWAREDGLVGKGGYSCVGAVVAPHGIDTTIRLRRAMPQSLFLVPGFGAQGKTADEVAACFDADGAGAIVNASRSVIYAYQDPTYAERHGNDWREAIRAACRDFVAAIRGALNR